MQKEFGDEMILSIEDKHFRGLKFTKSSKFTKKIYEDLIKEDNSFNRLKYKNTMSEELDELIHIKLSLELVFKLFAGLTFGIAIYLMIHQIVIFATIVFITSLVSQILNTYCNTRVIEQNIASKQIKDVVDFIFEMDDK